MLKYNNRKNYFFGFFTTSPGICLLLAGVRFMVSFFACTLISLTMGFAISFEVEVVISVETDFVWKNGSISTFEIIFNPKI